MASLYNYTIDGNNYGYATTLPEVPWAYIGVGIAAAIGIGALYAYCKSSRGNSRCGFPCEPFVNKCSERVVRVREDI